MFIVFPRLRIRISVFALPTMLLMLWLEGIAPFLMIFLSAAMHEIGHIAAMRLCGYNIRRLDILPMGALIVCPEGIPNRDEVAIALSGPLMSLFCAAAASVWFLSSGSADALFAALINLVLGLFNLLPVRKLDGGKALCCFLADKITTETAERICSLASVTAKIVFLCFSMVCILISDLNLGVIILSATLFFQLLTER